MSKGTLQDFQDLFKVKKIPVGLNKISKHQAGKKNYNHFHKLSKGQLNTNLPLPKNLQQVKDFENLPEYTGEVENEAINN